jgi:7,8-dihydropterin-6-yl-methyl-4-(beta-D-ribofuranosyl)aminobenzene 5'-phosphate synthase
MAFEVITQANGGPAIPCYLHPGMFPVARLALLGGELLPVEEIPLPDDLAAKGAVPVVTTESQVLLDDMFLVSGEIPESPVVRRVFRAKSGAAKMANLGKTIR